MKLINSVREYFDKTPNSKIIKDWLEAGSVSNLKDGIETSSEPDEKEAHITHYEEEVEAFKSAIPLIEGTYGVKVLLAYVRGSHMYGTTTEASDVDITVIYQQPTKDILRGRYKEQINFSKDIVGYEIERFLWLLYRNNPNVLEALNIPEDCIIYKDTDIDAVLHQKFWLSKKTKNTILGYANSQLKKATGLNKKMNNPITTKKDIIDFCYLIYGSESYPLRKYAEINDIDLSRVGLIKINNGKGLYAMYVDWDLSQNFRGIIKNEDSTQIRVSEIPVDISENCFPITIYYNQDGFESWKKDYESYQTWEKERNQERYSNNLEAGQQIDLKNTMHMFRLLDMAFNISIGEGLIVRSDDTEWLMEIRRGEIPYKDLMEDAETLISLIKSNYEILELQDTPNENIVRDLLYNFRKSDYEKNN